MPYPFKMADQDAAINHVSTRVQTDVEIIDNSALRLTHCG